MVSENPPTKELFSPSDLAKYLDVPLSTIYNWNYHKSGPRVLKVGKHVRYRKSDVEAWLDAQEQAS